MEEPEQIDFIVSSSSIVRDPRAQLNVEAKCSLWPRVLLWRGFFYKE